MVHQTALFARDVIKTDVNALGKRSHVDGQFLITCAERSQARSALLSSLRRRSHYTRQTMVTLPAELRQFGESYLLAAETVNSQSLVLEELHSPIQDLKEQEFRKLQVELTKTQIRESRVAIHQSTLVTKLTILAFICIPTSCVCGVFGMNIIETPNGFPLWVFGLTLSIVIVSTVFLSFASTLHHLWLKGATRLLIWKVKLVRHQSVRWGPVWKRAEPRLAVVTLLEVLLCIPKALGYICSRVFQRLQVILDNGKQLSELDKRAAQSRNGAQPVEEHLVTLQENYRAFQDNSPRERTLYFWIRFFRETAR
jgi:hypothetical protein